MDARGTRCPLPTVRAALALERLRPGERIRLIADDPTTERDLPAWCREFGHRLVARDERRGEFWFLIEKKSR